MPQLRGEESGEDPGVVSDEEEEAGEEGEEEAVDIEEEIDEEDPVAARRDELAGLELLRQRFLLPIQPSTQVPTHGFLTFPLTPSALL